MTYPSLKQRRSPRQGRSGAAGALIALVAAGEAQAQHRHRERHAPQQAAAGDARGLFEQGVALADRQRWAEALDAFQRSLALAPRPSTRFNVAQALLRLGRYRAAIAGFEAHLAPDSPDPDGGRVAQSRALLAEARGHIVAVTLTAVPPDAEVFADGVAEPGSGATRSLTLDPGLRRFEVRARDGRSERFELTLASGAPVTRAVTAGEAAADAPTVAGAQARAAFERGRQALLARRYDNASEAFHEVARLEPTPNTWRWLGVTLRSIGRYGESLAALERYLDSPDAGATPETLAQVRAAMAEMRGLQGRLSVTVHPAGAQLFIDARPRAVAGELTLDPGTHVVELRAEGHAPLRREVTLARGGQAVMALRLEELPGRIVVEPSAAGASVRIDGETAGAGRVERERPAGEHLVEITAPDHEPFRRSVHVAAGGVVRVDATLARRRLPGWVAPVVVAGGVLLIGGLTTAIVLATRGTEAPLTPSLGNYVEALRAP